MYKNLSKIFKLLINSKISFSSPQKKSLVVIDDVRSKYIIPLVKNHNYVFLPVRLNRIHKIYLSFSILRKVLSKVFKYRLSTNYFISVIEAIQPKLVITYIDNSRLYHQLSKYFNNKIKFFAIQNASRVNTLADQFSRKDYFHQSYAHFGNYEKKIYKNAHVSKFFKVGSLRQSYAMEYFKKNKTKIKKNFYDICLVSDNAWGYDKIYNQDGIEDSWGKVYEFTFRFAKKHKKKIVFVSECDYSNKSKESLEEIRKEKQFYQKYLKNYKYKLIPRFEKQHTTYKYVLESKIVISVITSILTEALAANKKIFPCNFSKIEELNFPIKKTTLNNCDYSLFEKKLKELFKMNLKKYHSYFLGKDKNLLIDVGSNSKDTITRLKKRVDEYMGL